MATIKSHTDLPQSKKLAEFLPLESADLWYQHISVSWSLAALLNILPSGKALIHDKESNYYKCICNNIDTALYNNPIDACVDMIEKLHELNLL